MNDGFFGWANDQFRRQNPLDPRGKRSSARSMRVGHTRFVRELLRHRSQPQLGYQLVWDWFIRQPCSGSYCGSGPNGAPFRNPKCARWRILCAALRRQSTSIIIGVATCTCSPMAGRRAPADHDQIDPVRRRQGRDRPALRSQLPPCPTFTTIYPASGLGLDYMYRNDDFQVPFALRPRCPSNGNAQPTPCCQARRKCGRGSRRRVCSCSITRKLTQKATATGPAAAQKELKQNPTPSEREMAAKRCLYCTSPYTGRN